MSLLIISIRCNSCFLFSEPELCHAGSSGRVLLKGMTYNELEVLVKHIYCSLCPVMFSQYTIFVQDWVKHSGHTSNQAMMLWKWLYGNGKWAQHVDDLDGKANILFWAFF